MEKHSGSVILRLIRVIMAIVFAVMSLVNVAKVGCATPKAIYNLLWAIFLLI